MSKIENNINAEQVLYSEAQVLDMLQVKADTLRKWRAAKLIGFSKIGKKIYFSKEDILNFHSSHHVDAVSKDQK